MLEIGVGTLASGALHLSPCEKACPCGQGTASMEGKWRQSSSTWCWSHCGSWVAEAQATHLMSCWVTFSDSKQPWGAFYAQFMKFDPQGLEVLVTKLCVHTCKRRASAIADVTVIKELRY